MTSCHWPNSCSLKRWRRNEDLSQYFSAFLKNLKDSLVDKKTKTWENIWWHIFGELLLNRVCISSTLVHTASFPPHQQAEVVLIFPWGFLFTVCWLAERAGGCLPETLLSNHWFAIKARPRIPPPNVWRSNASNRVRAYTSYIHAIRALNTTEWPNQTKQWLLELGRAAKLKSKRSWKSKATVDSWWFVDTEWCQKCDVLPNVVTYNLPQCLKLNKA